MHRKFELLSPGKMSSQSAALPSFFFWLFFSPCDSIPPAVRPTLLQQMDMGSLTCAHILVRAIHTKGGQAQTSLHKSWLVGIEKLFFTLPCQGVKLTVFRFEFWLTTASSTVFCLVPGHCSFCLLFFLLSLLLYFASTSSLAGIPI